MNFFTGIMEDLDESNPVSSNRRKERKQRRGPKQKRCQVCREPLENDGYGDFVHAATGHYGEYDYDNGNLTHVATPR